MTSPLSATMLQRVPYVDETLLDDLNDHDMDALSVHLTLWTSCNAFHKKVVAFLHRVCEEQESSVRSSSQARCSDGRRSKGLPLAGFPYRGR